MDVKDILTQVSYLSSGLDDPVSDLKEVDSGNINAAENIDLRIHLNHLNLIHLELYRITAMYNPAIRTVKEIVTVQKDGYLSKIINHYVIAGIYDKANGNKLEQRGVSEMIDADPLGVEVGVPKYWYNNGNQIVLYPKPINESDIVVWYKEAPKALEVTTKEIDIPYPSFYHQVLVDGTSYYVFQSETGLKNQTEIALANAQWEKGKQEMLSYFTNTAGITHQSTHSGLI